MNDHKSTHTVTDTFVCVVYELPASLTCRYKWLTNDEDVRAIERMLVVVPKIIGAPL